MAHLSRSHYNFYLFFYCVKILILVNFYCFKEKFTLLMMCELFLFSSIPSKIQSWPSLKAIFRFFSRLHSDQAAVLPAQA